MGFRYDQAVFAHSVELRDVFEMCMIAVAQSVIQNNSEDTPHKHLVDFAKRLVAFPSPIMERALDLAMMQAVWDEAIMSHGVVRDGYVYPERLPDEDADDFIRRMWPILARSCLGPPREVAE